MHTPTSMRLAEEQGKGIPYQLSKIVSSVLAVAFILLVIWLDFGCPWWASIIAILYALVVTYINGYLYGLVNQTVVGAGCILLQIVFGFLVPGSAKANEGGPARPERGGLHHTTA